MNRTIGIVVAIIVILVVAGLFLWHSGSSNQNGSYGAPINQSPSSSMPGMNMQGSAAPAPSSSAPASGAASVSIANFAYAPATITVKVGTTVTWTNEDSAPHTVTPDSGSGFGSGMMQKGDTYSHAFTTAGTFTYHCTVHPYMHGTVIVTQ